MEVHALHDRFGLGQVGQELLQHDTAESGVRNAVVNIFTASSQSYLPIGLFRSVFESVCRLVERQY